MGLGTVPFDASDTLSEEGLDALVADAAESGDPNYLIVALRTVARGRGMAQVARGLGYQLRLEAV